MTDPHILWAVAQLLPGEGIEDGVERITALLAESRDCRTCSHYRYSGRVDCCADICTNADRYDPLPVVRLWKKEIK